MWALALLLLALFAWGAEQVAVMPLETGEVYPLYSTLRADPLGAMALYQSLAALPELNVSRLYKRRSVLDAGAALLVLGVDAGAWNQTAENKIDADTIDGYEHLIQKGGRLLIAFLPARAPNEFSGSFATSVIVRAKWDLGLAYHKRHGEDVTLAAIPRRSALYFDPGPEWSILAQRDGAAVAVERTLAGGTLVLVSESYPLSNEGLRESRDAASIARLIGPARRIVFDENHFGVAEEGSVVGLLRKYRLQGALAILLVVVALFVWRSASSFLPPREGFKEQQRVIPGRDSQEGLTSLLRRSVPEPQLLDACHREWMRSTPSTRQAQLVEAEIARWRGRPPVDAYRAACQVLTEKK
jgi:hypothetical protein